jgi:hypothetical protein
VIATDPVTRKETIWSSPPDAPLYTIPIWACTNDRAAARWIMPCEQPDLTAMLGTNYFVGGKGFCGQDHALWKFSSTRTFVEAYTTGFNTSYSLSDLLMGPMHTGVAIAASATSNQVEMLITETPGGPGNARIYTYPADAAALTGLGSMNYESAQIGNPLSNIDKLYMPQYVVTTDNKRFIGGAWHTADGRVHAAVMTNSSCAVTGWTKQPLVYDDGNSLQYYVSALGTSGTGATTVLVACISGLYGVGRFGLAYSLDNGATWNYLAPNTLPACAATAVPAGGTAQASFDGTPATYTDTKWLWRDTAKTLIPSRILISGTTAYVLLKRLTTTSPYYDPSGNTGFYVATCVLTAGSESFTLSGPFFAEHSGWFSVPDGQWNGDASRIRLARCIPSGASIDTDYKNYPYGGNSIGIYTWNPADPTTAPVLTNTIPLPSGGSQHPYTDKVEGWYPYHETGYGDGQVFLGARWVKGASGLVAVNISDQRVQDVYSAFHMSRVAIFDVGA